jgi:hypothetical protein
LRTREFFQKSGRRILSYSSVCNQDAMGSRKQEGISDAGKETILNRPF